MWFIFISLATLITHALGCGYARNGDDYYPLDVCFFDFNNSFSFIHRCYGDALNDVAYMNLDCAGTAALNASCHTLTGCDEPYCHVDGSCDYVELTWHSPNRGQSLDCNALESTAHKEHNYHTRIINKCLLEPSNGLYKLDTCTNSQWNTFRYSDANCDSIVYRNQFVESCVDGSDSYGEITQCTAPLNTIGDECGYIQYNKYSVLAPLDQCFVINEGRANYKFTCIDDLPYYYAWSANNGCDPSIIPDHNFTIAPFSYSCANQCDSVEIMTYENVNNDCSTVEHVQNISNLNYTSNNIITNKCYNWFGPNHFTRSSIIICDESNGIAYENVYNTSDCDESFGIFATLSWSEECDPNSDSFYKIKCNIVTQNVTETYPPSLNPTASPVTTTPAPQLSYEKVLYVSADGNDNIFCGETPIDACGTLYYATNKAVLFPLCTRETISFCSFTDLEELLSQIVPTEIIVQGQNLASIESTKLLFKLNPCVPHQLFNWADASITFDQEYIHEMDDWYPQDLCENITDLEITEHMMNNFIGVGHGIPHLTTLTMNNLIIDSYEFNGKAIRPHYIIESENKVICNHCKFTNIIIDSNHHLVTNDSALISGRDITFRNCLFENISYVSSGSDLYDHSFIKVDSSMESANYEKLRIFNFEMVHSTVKRINMLNTFVWLNPSFFTWGGTDANLSFSNESVSVNTLIQYNTFDQISIVDAIFYHNPTAPLTAYLQILDTEIFNLNLGSVLHLVESTSIVNISNVNITTRQTIKKYIDTKESIGRDDSDLYSLFVSESVLNVIVIENVNIMYYYMDYLFENCLEGIYSANDWYTLEQYFPEFIDVWYVNYLCEVPIQFMDSASSVTINYLSVSNDMNNAQFETLRNELISIIRSIFGTSKPIYIEWMYDFNTLDHAFIYNEGTMTMNSFTVYGSGAHYQMIVSPSGDLFIDGMNAIPETHYDPDVIHISNWITFGTDVATSSNVGCGSELNIRNSFLSSGFAAINVKYGYAYIHNITIQNTLMGINTRYQSSIELTSSLMIDIGKYYAGAFFYLRWYEPLFVPFGFRSGSTIIKDTVFSYVDPYQFDMFSPIQLAHSETDNEIDILLIDNTFEINDQNVVVPYPFNHTLAKFENMQTSENSLDFESNVNLHQYFLGYGMMVFADNQNIQMINNKFIVNPNNLYVNESTLLDGDFAWIYDKNSNGDVCMSGNEFTSFAIHLTQGSINSCVKTSLNQYFGVDGCYGFGTFGNNDISAINYNAHQPNVFNVNSYDLKDIIRLEKDTSITLYNNVINMHHLKMENKVINLMNIENGNYLFVDTAINGSKQWDINISPRCIVHCYSVLKHNLQLIPILHVTCNSTANASLSSINDMYTAETLDHWSPYSIDIYAESNGHYFPGDRLKFQYSIFDAYDNEISADSINQEITINVESTNKTEFFADFPLIIGTDGACAVCESGIFFITATLDNSGNNYSLSATVENNALVVNDLIDISITDCPAGYGSSGTAQQCDVCSKGFFTLFSTKSSCIDCHSDEIDGIACPGRDQVIVEDSYWIAIYGYPGYNDALFEPQSQINSFITPSNDSVDRHILSGKCATGYCCTSTDVGCDFLSGDLCAANRDPTVYLCGECIAGFSELFGTNACGQCSDEYWYRIFIPICFGIFISIYIVISQSSKARKPLEHNQNQKPTSKCIRLIAAFNHICCSKNDEENNSNLKHPKTMTKQEFTDTIEVFITKCIIYYYQTISNLLLSTNGVPNAIISFVGLFNFDVFARISNSDNNGYCLFSDLTAIAKITVQLTTTLSIICFVFLSYALHKLFSLNIVKPMKRKPHFGRAFLKVSFLCVGQVLSVLFQLLACRTVGNESNSVSVHYFFGSHACYGIIWMIALLALIIVVLYFVTLFCIIRKKIRSNEKNGDLPLSSPNGAVIMDTKEMYHSAVWCYREKYWFWELILFFRRLFLAFALIVFDSNDLQMVTALILMIYLFVQITSNPFKFKDVNKFEAYLIGCTILLITLNANYQNNSVNTVGNVLISLLILFPIFWFMYYILSRCQRMTKKNGYVHTTNNSQIITQVGDDDNYHVVDVMELAIRNAFKTEPEALQKQTSTQL